MAQTAYSYKAVTTSDATDIPDGPCDALWVGVGGDVAILPPSGAAVTFKNVPSGFLLLAQAKRVNSTYTTATDIVALYA